MNKQFLKDALVWGFLLWLFGYILGVALFMVVPMEVLGWVIMPLGIALTLWVLTKKVKGDTKKYYILLGIVWMVLAIILDYLLLVKLLKPEDGYYKLDVYLYYALTFLLPVLWGWKIGK